MSGSQELAVREKQELAKKGRENHSWPLLRLSADIHESDEALTVVLEMPGVAKENVNIDIDNDVLRVEGQIDFSGYQELEPGYTEYNVGHYARGFTLSSKIDREAISARLGDGVLTLTLPKAKEAMPRRIAVR